MNIVTQESQLLSSTLVPAQIWYGKHDDLIIRVITYLQKILCSQQGCTRCITCKHIEEKQHHAIVWIAPEKNYTLDDIQPIFSTIAFALGEDDHFFFILQKADFLTPTCANSLLKSIEEPPAGYHFILLAERQEQILPTIRSRCIAQTFYSAMPLSISPLFEYFSTQGPTQAQEFLSALEQSKINERESTELIDSLLSHWITQFKNALMNNDETKSAIAQQMILTLKTAATHPPMPGSSKIFWKNLFLQIKTKAI